jgi:hypothetical protein
VVWYKVPRQPVGVRHWPRQVVSWGGAPGLSHYIDIGDVDGDGRADVATAAKWPPLGNWFAWWKQPPESAAQWQKHVVSAAEEGATNILIRDLNGDRKPDLVASRGHGFGVLWFEGPSWIPRDIDPDLGGPHSLAAADIDRDGDIDIATCGKNTRKVRWYQNDGRGNFRIHEVAAGQAAYDLKLVDINLDGRLDILIAGQDSANVVWFENPGR